MGVRYLLRRKLWHDAGVLHTDQLTADQTAIKLHDWLWAALLYPVKAQY